MLPEQASGLPAGGQRCWCGCAQTDAAQIPWAPSWRRPARTRCGSHGCPQPCQCTALKRRGASFFWSACEFPQLHGYEGGCLHKTSVPRPPPSFNTLGSLLSWAVDLAKATGIPSSLPPLSRAECYIGNATLPDLACTAVLPRPGFMSCLAPPHAGIPQSCLASP